MLKAKWWRDEVQKCAVKLPEGGGASTARRDDADLKALGSARHARETRRTAFTTQLFESVRCRCDYSLGLSILRLSSLSGGVPMSQQSGFGLRTLPRGT